MYLDARQWQQVRALFATVADAPGERKRIAAAIGLLENQVGRIAGTWRDRGGNIAGSGLPGQLDCIAESKNTTTYLKLLARDGLLRWHRVDARRLRHPWILDLHWTAVIRERGSGRAYAVDSWFLDNGQPPYIQPLGDWLSGRRPDGGQKHLGD
ncbi:MAG TPA: hypothetical protein ENK05_13085 [Gammaproteobacteria bacterium]|nr:hypothetical protein [Gammaproteobacteria bacterium]